MWWLVACTPKTTDDGPASSPTAHTGAPTADDTAPTDPTDTPTDTGGHTGSPTTTGTWTGTDGTFTGTTRGRDWILYVPPSYTATTASPLVVAFHGAGDSAPNFANVVAATGWTAAADARGFLLLIPATTSPYHDFAVWSGNPNDDFDEMQVEMDDVLALTDELGDTWHLDPDQRHAFGFSDGGLFLAVAGMGAADRWATLGVFGYGWGGFTIVTPSRALPVAFVVGANDGFANAARDSEAWLSGQGHDTRLDVVPGVGHLFSGLMGGVPPADLADWMLARPR